MPRSKAAAMTMVTGDVSHERVSVAVRAAEFCGALRSKSWVKAEDSVGASDFLNDVPGPAFGFGVDFRQVFAHDAKAKQLDAAKKIYRQNS